MKMNGRNPRSDRNGCGCPGAEDDDLFEAGAWAVGIDVSHHQDTVNWLKVRGAGYSFVFLKATEGGTYVDQTFVLNRDRAAAAGFYVGAYHFYRPATAPEVQARNFLNTVGSLRSRELPPVLDIEDERLWKGISSKDAIVMVQKWCKQVQTALGVAPIIYASPSFVSHVLANDPALREFVLWLAHYTTNEQPTVPAPWTRWTFWQHSEHGHVDGITTEVDLNRFNGTEGQLASLARFNEALIPVTTGVRWWWLRLLMRLGF